jgi:hypothetical protein
MSSIRNKKYNSSKGSSSSSKHEKTDEKEMDNDTKFNHEFISVKTLNKKFLMVELKKDDKKYWEEFLDESLEYSKEHKCWVLVHEELKDFIELVKNVEDDKDRSDSESDSTDDELIQKTLTRRLTSESKQLVIEDTHVSDSEMEDVLSSIRRIRGLYKMIRGLEKRIEYLENNRS